MLLKKALDKSNRKLNKICVGKGNELYNSSLTLVKKLMIKILNLKLAILLEYQNIESFLEKAVFRIGLKKFL